MDINKCKNDVSTTNVDPIKSRNLDHPVSDCFTLIHFLKASLGTGLLAMPAAFMNAGLVVGVVATALISFICSHCAYMLVVCGHDLYRRSGKNSMTFADIAEECCRHGPKWSKPLAMVSRHVVSFGLFLAYFTTCSCYTVIIAKNIEHVAHKYMETVIDTRLLIGMLLLPLIILVCIPNLKYLTPVSMLANILMGISLGITFYYLVQDIPPISERRLASPIGTFPIFLSLTMFSITTIGIVMPLENQMKSPQHFISPFGVLTKGMICITVLYIFLGFLGYLKYGDETEGSIPLNLPEDEYLAQSVQLLVALTLFFTTGLQFVVTMEIAWNAIKDSFTTRPILSNYILRIVLITLSVGLAVAVPTIIPFVTLIGAFCFSILGLIIPVFIEVVTFWEKGFGRYNWKIVKHVIALATGIAGLIFGSISAIQDIIKMYTEGEDA